MFIKAATIASLGLLLFAPSAFAQGLVTQRVLSLALARTMAEAALADCKTKGFNTAVAVVDRAGDVLVVMRDEQATRQMVEMARRKAVTARLFRMSTMDFQKRTASDPLYAAQRDVADVLALGGGLPIQAGTDVIGGIGNSGSAQDTDEACAAAGLAKVAHLLK